MSFWVVGSYIYERECSQGSKAVADERSDGA